MGRHKRGQSRCQMEREELVGPRFGDRRRRLFLRLGFFAGGFLGGISRPWAASVPLMSRNGMGAVGRLWVRDWTTRCMLWRYPALICMRGALSRWRVATRPDSLQNGMGAVGRHWVLGWTIMYWLS